MNLTRLAFLSTPSILSLGLIALGCDDESTTATSGNTTAAGGQGGTGAATSSTSTQVSTGGSGGCSVPADCPGMDTECQQRTCTNSTCGTIFVAAGMPAMTQLPGDCKENQCDG